MKPLTTGLMHWVKEYLFENTRDFETLETGLGL